MMTAPRTPLGTKAAPPAAPGPSGVAALRMSAGETTRLIASGDTTEWEVKLVLTGREKEAVTLKVDTILDATEEGAPEWHVRLYDVLGLLWDSQAAGTQPKDVELEADREKSLTLSVHAPSGARFGDKVTVVLRGQLSNDPRVTTSQSFQVTARQSILAVKTSIGHEKAVADGIASRLKPKNVGIFAILSPATLRGYVLIEAMNTDALKDVVKSVRKTRGIVQGETALGEIDHFLTPKPIVSGIIEGDIVELIAGPFKGEKARVRNIDEAKEEITVELFEAMVPIPVTVRGDHVRVLEKEK